MFNDYRDLDVWKRGMAIAKLVYQLTKSYPREEQFGLTSQMRRAAVSIPSNLAEGWGRSTSKEFRQFIRIAQGSLKELETQLILSHEVELTSEEKTKPMLNETTILGKQLVALTRSLERGMANGES